MAEAEVLTGNVICGAVEVAVLIFTKVDGLVLHK
jgi:hypothetical protein